MRFVRASLAALCVVMPLTVQDLAAQEKVTDGPTNEKAQKTFKQAMDCLHDRDAAGALGVFKKADKVDNGHCLACQRQMTRIGTQFGEWKVAELAGEEMVGEAQEPRPVALAHYQLGSVLVAEGYQRHKDEFFSRAHEEFVKALAAASNFPDAYFLDGRALAQLKQDEVAKARFEQFAKMSPEKDVNRQRALRFVGNPELARARMAPSFEITTLDEKHVSMDDLQGQVVLIDFWATGCEPCREALPHIRDVARKFQGQPLVIISISLDTDQQKWKDFVAKNEMTWAQYFDGGFQGPIARMFGVNAIPHTFTIDADGVLQEEHVGDASIEGKLKKLIARAKELQASGVVTQDVGKAALDTN